MRTQACLDCLAATRGRLPEIPLVPMTYSSLLEAYGWDRFAADARAAGARGLFVADLRAGERPELRRVQLVAPPSTDERLRLAAAATDGWLYLVTVTGTTGARAELSPALASLVERARRATALPLYAGFGISTPEQARAAAELADGIVVGSRGGEAAEGSAGAARALVAETAVAPGDVDHAAGVDVGRRQRRRADAGYVLGVHARDAHHGAERAAAVGRAHRLDLARGGVGEVVSAGGKVEDDDERAVRPDDGLGAVHEPELGPRRRDRRSGPGEAAVGRAARPDLGRPRVEVREVAASAERAREPVVADEPLLVVVLGRIAGRDDRRAPREAVPGAADERAHAELRLGDGRDQPDSVQRVVGDDGVARGGRVAVRLRRRRQRRQEPAAPVGAPVPRGREADPRRAAVDHPAGLEGGHDRRADRVAVGLDLRLVLALRVGERVARELPRHDLAAPADGVGELGHGHVTAGAAANGVAGAVVGDGEPVAARTAGEDVASGAAVEQVGAAAAVERVGARAAEYRVGRAGSDQAVGAGG